MLAIKNICYLCQQNQAVHSESGEVVIILYSRWGIEGYVTLPGGVVIEWGIAKGTSSSSASWATVYFSKRFSSIPLVVTGLTWTSTTTDSGHGYIRQGYLTESGMQVSVTRASVELFWVAIGKA